MTLSVQSNTLWVKKSKYMFTKISGTKMDKVRSQFREAHNKEVCVLYRPFSITGQVKSSCLLWVGPIARMRKLWNVCWILAENTQIKVTWKTYNGYCDQLWVLFWVVIFSTSQAVIHEIFKMWHPCIWKTLNTANLFQGWWNVFMVSPMLPLPDLLCVVLACIYVEYLTLSYIDPWNICKKAIRCSVFQEEASVA